jgi:uncharacterized protein
MTDVRPNGETSRAGRLDRVVSDLLAHAPEIEAAAVVSFDGLPMVSALPPTMDEDRVAAMSAALLSLGERAAEGLGRGELSQVYIEGESGTVFLVSCDNEAVLVAVGAAGAKVGLMLFEVRRAAVAVAAVLRVEDEPAPQPVHQAVYQPAPVIPAPPVQPAATRPAQPAPAPVEPTYAPVTDPAQVAEVASGAPADPAYGYAAPTNGWSSFAPGSQPAGDPSPWS